MDLITHGIAGAALAASLAPQQQRRIAALVGCVAGMLPDADALIRSADDVLLVLDYHRHFTHALLFIPLGALLATLLWWPILMLRERMAFPALYGYSLAGYAQGGLLDACTSYGTHLLLPFDDAQTAWNIIAVFDPLFSLLLLIPLLLTLHRPQRRLAPLGIALAVAYLGLGIIQHQRASAAAQEIATARGHAPVEIVVKPTMANQILWRTLYVHDGKLQADAFHLGHRVRHYPGEAMTLMNEGTLREIAAGNARKADDLERFRRFSDGYLIADPNHPGFVGDGRYALLPTRIAPIWGLEWRSDDTPAFVTRRDVTPETRRAFINMLLGR